MRRRVLVVNSHTKRDTAADVINLPHLSLSWLYPDRLWANRTCLRVDFVTLSLLNVNLSHPEFPVSRPVTTQIQPHLPPLHNHILTFISVEVVVVRIVALTICLSRRRHLSTLQPYSSFLVPGLS
jgi:hypothetical protein